MRKAITAYKTAKVGATVIWWACPKHRCQEFQLETKPAPELVNNQYVCAKCSSEYIILGILVENSAVVRITIEIK